MQGENAIPANPPRSHGDRARERQSQKGRGRRTVAPVPATALAPDKWRLRHGNALAGKVEGAYDGSTTTQGISGERKSGENDGSGSLVVGSGGEIVIQAGNIDAGKVEIQGPGPHGVAGSVLPRA